MSEPSISELQANGDVKRLIKLLRNKDAAVRRAAAGALGKIGDGRATRRLIKTLRDEDANVRRTAVVALGKIGDSRAIPALVTAVKDPNETPGVRKAAAKALAGTGAGAIGPLAAAVEEIKIPSGATDTEREVVVEVRFAAHQALALLGDARVMGDLVAWVRAGSKRTKDRVAAADALGSLGDTASVDPLAKSLAAVRDDAVREAIARALGKIGDPRAIGPLEATLDDEAVGGAAQKALEEIRGAAAGDPLSVAPSSLTSVVDVMLAIYLHDPATLLSDMPSGSRLKSIAAETLRRQDPTQDLSRDAYVRTVVAGGTQPMADMERQARRDAPGMMKDLLRERGLNSGSYRQEVWTEELSPEIRVVWVAAIRGK